MWSEFLSFFICEMGPTLWSSGSRTELGAQILPTPPRSCEKPCAHVQTMEQNKTGPSQEMRDVNRTSRKRDESKMVPWESVLGMSLERWAGCWQAVRGGAIPQGRKAVKEGGLLLLDSYVQPSLFDSRVQPSSAKASCPAHINHFSSLLRGVSTVSLHHRWRALDVLLDGWHQTSITIS